MVWALMTGVDEDCSMAKLNKTVLSGSLQSRYWFRKRMGFAAHMNGSVLSRNS